MTTTASPLSTDTLYDGIAWDYRTVHLYNGATGEVILHQEDVEVPAFWSQNATNILVSKYFRGHVGTPERETSLKQVIDRVVDTIATWGRARSYFDNDGDLTVFTVALKRSLLFQESSFNSPVWFNIGVAGVPQQASACFILDVEDSMESILNWYKEEGIIFKGGSGAGVNLSKIRSSMEPLAGGGTASGPVSFMRGADASAGTIKSGGKTRRAAKMVVLDVDHPDIEEFVATKAREEKKIRALSEAGFDMGLNGIDINSVQYQNANNSVRVTDEFMEAVEQDLDWDLKAVATEETVRTVRARELWHQIAQAAWECADPGMQYDTTINKWNTVADTARIDASNPCSEYMHISNSACNLASLNLLTFYDAELGFNTGKFMATVRNYVIAQDILVGNADYPTPAITENARKYRELGLGYANLGALLMAMGMSYDSEAGRLVAAAITSLLSAVAYSTSVELAANPAIGPCDGYESNKNSMRRVLEMHATANTQLIHDLTTTPDNPLAYSLALVAKEHWEKILDSVDAVGIRNTQISLLAPTGTIGFLMDCDTTGIEPAFSLVSYKEFVGGNAAKLTIRAVADGLTALGYSPSARDEVLAYVAEHDTMLGAPHISEADYHVFATAVGDNALSPQAHLTMMAAVQPFLSGAISKTVNLPNNTTVEDVADTFFDGWKLGLKAVALYRDGCKVGQPLSVKASATPDEAAIAMVDDVTEALTKIGTLQDENARLRDDLNSLVRDMQRGSAGPQKRRMPHKRHSITYSTTIGDSTVYTTIGHYENGDPGEVFLRASKQGSTLAGILDAFAIVLSIGLQYGVPLEDYTNKLRAMRFEPAGITDDRDIRIVSSIMDWLSRRLSQDYLDREDTDDLSGPLDASPASIYDDLVQPMAAVNFVETSEAHDNGTASFTAGTHDHHMTADTSTPPVVRNESIDTGNMCPLCGSLMIRSGSCFVCPSDGTTSGCS